MARNPRRSDPTGSYRKRVEESDAYENIAGMLPGIGTAMTVRDIKEELQEEDPSWGKIGLLTAGEVVGIVPGLGDVAQNMVRQGVKRFKTKKGSTYEVKEGNTTVRDKAARPEHPGESGIQPQSVKTIYMPRSELEKFGGVHQNPDIPTEFIPTGSDTAALRLTKDWGPLKAGEILPETEVKFTLDPEVGLNPVEILDFKSPRGIHFGNEIIEVESNIPKVSKKYAEGGVAMDEQMDAVFKSSRTDIDPVSGNEVPPGSLPEEVRDDIPAMLSEGEYVVPADVLRFYGVKFFEDLRAQAKMGLAEMEANGRIGGEPIEEETEDVGISDEDLMVIMAQAPQEEQAVGASNGGLMGFQTGGLNLPEFEIEEEGGLEYRSYVNSAGNTISIPFFNNEPMAVIPEGYSPADEVVEEAAPQAVQDDDGFDAASAQRAREEIESGREDKTIDFSNPESVAGAVNTYYSSKPLLDMVTTTGLGLVGGLGASYGIKQLEKNNLLKGINAALDSGTIDTKTRNKLKRQKQFLEDKNEWKNEYEKKTEGLGLMDGIKSFFDFDLGDTAKQYSRDTEKYKSDKDWSAAATGKWVDATNLVQSLGSDADPREWHEAIQAQAEASREATAAAQAASGRTGFFSPPEEKEEDDE